MRLFDLFFPPKRKAPRLDVITAMNKDHEALRKEAEIVAAQKALEARIAAQADIQRARRRKPTP